MPSLLGFAFALAICAAMGALVVVAADRSQRRNGRSKP